MLAAAILTVALSGVSVSAALVGGSSSASAAPSTTCPAGASLQIPAGGSNSQATCVITSTGTPVGGVKHVWLIILENKSYDETFTGLNQNSYLWQTLAPAGRAPHQLLRHRPLQHGQLHLAGVRPGPLLRRAGRLLDDGQHDQQQQRDHHERHGRDGYRHGPHDRRLRDQHQRTHDATASTNGNYGQLLVHGGIDAALGSNGCVYPTDVDTLFNQYNAAGVSWKGYAQDLGGAQPVGSTTYVTGSTPGVTDTVPGRDDGACGYPGSSTSDNPVTNPTNLVRPDRRATSTSFTGAQPANANNNGDPADQFVAKHFPTGWFTSLTGESAGTQSGVTYPAAAGAQPAGHAGVRRPGRPDERQRATPTATPTTWPTSTTPPTAWPTT